MPLIPSVSYVSTIEELQAISVSNIADGQAINITTTGRAGSFVVKVGDYSQEVSEDSQKGIWVPFNEDPKGFNIVAHRIHGREVNLSWFGGVGDYDGSAGTDNWPAIMGALAVFSFKPEPAGYIIQPSKKLIVDDGSFYFSKSIPIRNAVWIEGAGNGLLGLRSTSFLFPANKHGFVTLHQSVDWDDDLEEVFITPSHRGGTAQGSLIQGVNIQCVDRDNTTRGVGDGIHIRSSINLRDVRIVGFGGDGLHSFVSGVSGDPSRRGENNNFNWENVLIQSCENGVSVRGPDSSAGYGGRIDVRHNRVWGIMDGSFLGNTWVAPHANGNGRVVGIANMENSGPDLLVTTGADHELVAGDEVTLEGYEGAASVGYWLYTVAEVVNATQFKVEDEQIKSWTPYVGGGEVGYGGPYTVKNISARSIIVGGYVEGGNQGACFFEAATIVTGGLMDSGVIGGFYHDPRKAFQNPINIHEPQSDVRVGYGHTSYGSALRMSGPGQNVFGTQLKWFNKFQDGGSWWFINGNGNQRMLGFTTDSSGLTFGRASPVVGVPVAGSIWIGNSENKARCVTGGDAAPTGGEWAKGDIIYNREPVPDGYVGWICTTGGVAGVDAVFKPFGHICV